MMFKGKLGAIGPNMGPVEHSVKWTWGKTKGGFNKAKSGVAGGAGLMGGLASGVHSKANNFKHGATLFVVASLVLFIFDVILDYRGFYITDVDPIGLLKAIMSFGYLVGVWALFFLLVSRNKSIPVVFWNVVVLIVIMITTGLVFKFNPIALIHMIFILILWFVYLRDQADPIRSNKILLGFLFVDLYLFSILNAFSPNIAEWFVGFPFLFLATNYYVWNKTDSRLAEFFIFLAFGWYFIMGGPAIADNLGMAGIEGIRDDLPAFGEMWKIGKKKLIEDPTQKIADSTRLWLTGRIEYAITGKVEENQYEPLGVYLERIQPAEPRFYEDEDVVVWGSVKARTLDDPINIKVGCYVKDDDEKIYADRVDPNKKFSVFAMEEQDFVCNFDKCCEGKTCSEDSECALEEGPNTVTTFANFNFETLSYLKVYFINRERRRAMVREGLDIFDEFDITDIKPTPIYTNGPAEIGMETSDPLISVSANPDVFPRFSLSIQNREGWEGAIKQLKELVLFFPKGVILNNEWEDCNKKFDEYTLETCKEKSCGELVNRECLNVCEPPKTDSDPNWDYFICINNNCVYSPDSEDYECYNDCESLIQEDTDYSDDTGYSDCAKTCNDNFDKCRQECEPLFVEQNQEYVGYSLDLSDIKVRDEFKDFEKFKMFNCKINPLLNEVLENTPITTKFFRVKARYNYTVEKPVTVNIEKLPEKLRKGGTDDDDEVSAITGKAQKIYAAMKSAIDSSDDNCIVEYGALNLGESEIVMSQIGSEIKFEQMSASGVVDKLDESVTAKLCLTGTGARVNHPKVRIEESGGKYQIKVGGDFDYNPNAYFNIKDRRYLYKAEKDAEGNERICFFVLREDNNPLWPEGCSEANEKGMDDDCFKDWIDDKKLLTCEEKEEGIVNEMLGKGYNIDFINDVSEFSNAIEQAVNSEEEICRVEFDKYPYFLSSSLQDNHRIEMLDVGGNLVVNTWKNDDISDNVRLQIDGKDQVDGYLPCVVNGNNFVRWFRYKEDDYKDKQHIYKSQVVLGRERAPGAYVNMIVEFTPEDDAGKTKRDLYKDRPLIYKTKGGTGARSNYICLVPTFSDGNKGCTLDSDTSRNNVDDDCLREIDLYGEDRIPICSVSVPAESPGEEPSPQPTSTPEPTTTPPSTPEPTLTPCVPSPTLPPPSMPGWIPTDSFNLGEDQCSHSWEYVGGGSDNAYPCDGDKRWRNGDNKDDYFQIQLEVTPNKDFKLVWKSDGYGWVGSFEVYADENPIKTYTLDRVTGCSMNEITVNNPPYTNDEEVVIKFQNTDIGSTKDFIGTHIWIYSSE